MKKIVTSLILLALFVVSPGSAYSQSIPSLIQFKVDVKGSVAQVRRLTHLSVVAHEVVNHPEFESRVRKAFFQKGKAFSYSDDSGDQVFQKMVDGAELNGQKDGIWQLSYVFAPQSRKCIGFGRWKKCSSWVLGWTYPKKPEVYINSLPWDDRDDCGIVGTQVHEQLHKLGYGHPVNNTATRYLSVPYAVGTIASEICKKHFIK